MERPKKYRFDDHALMHALDKPDHDFSTIDLSNTSLLDLLTENSPKSHLLEYVHILANALDGLVPEALLGIESNKDFLITDRQKKKIDWFDYAYAIAAGLSDDEIGTVAQTADDFSKYRVAMLQAGYMPQVQGNRSDGDMISTNDIPDAVLHQYYFMGLQRGLRAYERGNMPWATWPDHAPVTSNYEVTSFDQKAIVVMSALYVFGLAVPDDRMAQVIISSGHAGLSHIRRMLGDESASTTTSHFYPQVGSSPRRYS